MSNAKGSPRTLLRSQGSSNRIGRGRSGRSFTRSESSPNLVALTPGHALDPVCLALRFREPWSVFTLKPRPDGGVGGNVFLPVGHISSLVGMTHLWPSLSVDRLRDGEGIRLWRESRMDVLFAEDAVGAKNLESLCKANDVNAPGGSLPYINAEALAALVLDENLDGSLTSPFASGSFARARPLPTLRDRDPPLAGPLWRVAFRRIPARAQQRLTAVTDLAVACLGEAELGRYAARVLGVTCYIHRSGAATGSFRDSPVSPLKSPNHRSTSTCYSVVIAVVAPPATALDLSRGAEWEEVEEATRAELLPLARKLVQLLGLSDQIAPEIEPFGATVPCSPSLPLSPNTTIANIPEASSSSELDDDDAGPVLLQEPAAVPVGTPERARKTSGVPSSLGPSSSVARSPLEEALAADSVVAAPAAAVAANVEKDFDSAVVACDTLDAQLVAATSFAARVQELATLVYEAGGETALRHALDDACSGDSFAEYKKAALHRVTAAAAGLPGGGAWAFFPAGCGGSDKVKSAVRRSGGPAAQVASMRSQEQASPKEALSFAALFPEIAVTVLPAYSKGKRYGADLRASRRGSTASLPNADTLRKARSFADHYAASVAAANEEAQLVCSVLEGFIERHPLHHVVGSASRSPIETPPLIPSPQARDKATGPPKAAPKPAPKPAPKAVPKATDSEPIAIENNAGSSSAPLPNSRSRSVPQASGKSGERKPKPAALVSPVEKAADASEQFAKPVAESVEPPKPRDESTASQRSRHSTPGASRASRRDTPAQSASRSGERDPAASKPAGGQSKSTAVVVGLLAVAIAVGTASVAVLLEQNA